MASESEATSEIKSIITGLLTSNPLRCTLRQLCNDFINTVGYKIPHQKLGFRTVEDFLHSIPDTVELCGSGLNAEVKGVVKQKSAHINLMVVKQKKNSIPAHKRNLIKSARTSNSYYHHNETQSSRIPPTVQNRLRMLILKFPEGIYCTDLPTQYRKLFHEDIKFEQYRYRSLIEMCSDLSEIFHYIQVTSDDYVLYDKNKPMPCFNQNEKFKNTVDVPLIDWSKGSALIPEDVLHLSEIIPRCFTTDASVGDILEIRLGEIHSISKFWIYIRSAKFQTLKAEIQILFKLQRNRYLIPPLFLEEGLYCVVFHRNEYHRCVIIELPKQASQLVQVLFIDHGTVGDVNSNHLWFLPRRFSKLPCQAIESKLYKVLPAMAPNETTTKFQQLIANKLLLAEMMVVDKVNHILEIYLADVTNEENIFYINDKLVEGGYARFLDQGNV